MLLASGFRELERRALRAHKQVRFVRHEVVLEQRQPAVLQRPIGARGDLPLPSSDARVERRRERAGRGVGEVEVERQADERADAAAEGAAEALAIDERALRRRSETRACSRIQSSAYKNPATKAPLAAPPLSERAGNVMSCVAGSAFEGAAACARRRRERAWATSGGGAAIGSPKGRTRLST